MVDTRPAQRPARSRTKHLVFALFPVIAAYVAFSGTVFSAQAAAQENTRPPNFASSGTTSWTPASEEFLAPAFGPGPVMSDPAHPRVSNAESAATGKQATFHISDVSSPILLPWAQEELRRRNEQIISGKPGYQRSSACWPLGVPAFLLYPVLPTYIVQTPEKVVMISQQDAMVRHVYLNVPHSERVNPSWFGESVGHYEGDTLVVDTIGMNDKTYVDHYRTPHTDELRVVERFRLIDNDMTLEVNVYVEDPGAFTTPWNAVQRFSRTERGLLSSPMGGLSDYICADYPINYFNQDLEPIPQDDTPDF